MPWPPQVGELLQRRTEPLGIEYKLVKYMRNSETLRAPDSLKKVHPLGKAPTIEHDGKVVMESDAIIEYICNKIAGGKLSRGVNATDYGDYLGWLAFPEGTLFPGLGVDLFTRGPAAETMS